MNIMLIVYLYLFAIQNNVLFVVVCSAAAYVALCGQLEDNYQVLLANDVVFSALRAAHKPKAYLFPKVLY